MSSTRGKKWRNDSDYYITPQSTISSFLRAMRDEFPAFLTAPRFLDPCAGGHAGYAMAYPTALINAGVNHTSITTVDIRNDSPADYKGTDFLSWKPSVKYDVIITNPPFVHALPIIQRALTMVDDNGFVIMLLRLNFFGSQDRYDFWQTCRPAYAFVHSKRINFREAMQVGSKVQQDSVEYMHCVWMGAAHSPAWTQLRVIK